MTLFFLDFFDIRIGQQQKATCIALWQARFFTGTVEQRKAGATSNGFDISKNGFIIYSPASMYMNPIPVRKPGSNIEKLKKLVSMIYQDLPLGFRKSSFLIMSLVTCSSSSWFQLQRSTGSRKEPDQFENTAWRSNGVWGAAFQSCPIYPTACNQNILYNLLIWILTYNIIS